MAADAGRPIRVAVIGGGCAAMAAAFELTRPAHKGRYAVTVYQMGWRLGGKGASGRGPAQRVEEHGLHLWMGFYENAFRFMRDVYEEAARDPRRCPVATFAQAFEPSPDVAVTDRDGDGVWRHWVAHFPPGRGLPGDALTERNPFTVHGYLRQTATLVAEMIRSTHAAPAGATKRGRGDLAASVERLLRYGRLATATAVHEAAELLRGVFDVLSPPVFQGERQGLVLRLLDALAGFGQSQMERATAQDPELARVWQVIDMVLAILRGAVRFGLAVHPQGFDAIDGWDWRDWLRANGAADASLDAGFMRGIYDLAFAYEDGDVARPRISAAVALRGAMRMFFTYRGALFWRMTAGMGDIVFAPTYEVLKRRGVAFRFFHRLTDVRVGEPAAQGDAPHVAALEFDVQAEVSRGEYAPLVDVDGLPCWPSEPDWSQLRGGAALRKAKVRFESPWDPQVARRETLRVGDDFDLVVLAPSVAALPLCAAEVIARVPAWREMVARVKTVPTQALQLWLREDAQSLGWEGPAVNLSGFVEPFDTWADLTHLAPREGWAVLPKHIAYFCSVLDDRAVPAGAEARFEDAERDRVRGHAVTLLERDIAGLWPKAVDARGGFRWPLLVQEGASRRGREALASQFWNANVRPSDRYVLSLPGTSAYRISPLSMHLDNLTVAGDWTQTGLNSGCVESAVISGRLAAHALSGSPRLEDIVGYDHP
jgi:uncharacterized protein with NAD-binding domain and iron-sulfur cluster